MAYLTLAVLQKCSLNHAYEKKLFDSFDKNSGPWVVLVTDTYKDVSAMCRPSIQSLKECWQNTVINALKMSQDRIFYLSKRGETGIENFLLGLSSSRPESTQALGGSPRSVGGSPHRASKQKTLKRKGPEEQVGAAQKDDDSADEDAAAAPKPLKRRTSKSGVRVPKSKGVVSSPAPLPVPSSAPLPVRRLLLRVSDRGASVSSSVSSSAPSLVPSSARRLVLRVPERVDSVPSPAHESVAVSTSLFSINVEELCTSVKASCAAQEIDCIALDSASLDTNILSGLCGRKIIALVSLESLMRDLGSDGGVRMAELLRCIIQMKSACREFSCIILNDTGHGLDTSGGMLANFILQKMQREGISASSYLEHNFFGCFKFLGDAIDTFVARSRS